MKKQLQLVLSIILMALAGLTGYSQNFSVGNIEYKPTSATEVEIVDYAVTGGHVEIPSTVNNGANTYTVTAIGREAFEHNQLTSVEIPNSVTSIGHEAFRGNNLRKVTIPNSVTSIDGVSAFHLNPNLETMTVKRNDPPILAGNAFHTPQSSLRPSRENVDLLVPKDALGNYQDPNKGWTGFKSIIGIFTVNDTEYGITSTSPPEVRITDYTGTALEVEISETINYDGETYTVTAIGINVFRDKGLTSIDIPNSVTSIGAAAFYKNQLASVDIPKDVTTIGADAFRENQLTGVTIPEGVTSIEAGAFQSNELTQVIIPGRVTSIGSLAFDGNSLEKVFVKATDPPSLNQDAFEDRAQIDLVVPEEGVYKSNVQWTNPNFKSISSFIGQRFTVGEIEYAITSTSPDQVEVSGYSGSGTEAIIPPTVIDNGSNFTYTVTAIGDRAFQQKGMTSVSIPNTVTRIGQDAFWKNQLTSIVIPERLTILGQRAFGESGLTEVTIPEGVTSIPQWAFAQAQLTEVTIPANVEFIGKQAFLGAGSTNPIDVVTVKAKNPPALGEEVFVNRGKNREIIDLEVPLGTLVAYLDPANGWTGFRSISEIPEIGMTFSVDHIIYEVTSIDLNNEEVMVTDYNTEGGASVTIPSSVDHGLNTFTVTAIGDSAFYNDQLTSVTFADRSKVTSIGINGFRNNQFAHMTLPNGVTSIESNAFHGTPLKVLKVEATNPARVAENAFTNRDQIDLVAPEGTLEAYQAANDWTGFRFMSSGTFTVDDIDYAITATAPNEVMVVNYTNTAGQGVHVSIPETVDDQGETYTVTAIGNRAFYDANCWRVTIPGGVKSIGSQAFYGTNPIISVIVVGDADNPPTLAADAFQYPRRNHHINVTVPVPVENTLTLSSSNLNTALSNQVKAYEGTGWTGFRSISTLIGQRFDDDVLKYQITSIFPGGGGVTVVGYANKNNHGFSSGGHLVIPESVQGRQDRTYEVRHIGNDAFKHTFQGPKLTSVEMPSTLRRIGERAFLYNSLTEVILPEGLTHIGEDAFYGNQLTHVEIPSSVFLLGRTAFGDNQLTRVVLPRTGDIERWAFLSNKLTEIIIPAGIHGIGLYAFQNNPDLRLVTVEATDPPDLQRDGFANADRDQIDLVVPMGDIMIQAYLDNGWDGFRSISFGVFTIDDIKYGITAPNEVKVLDYTGTATEVKIPEAVDNNGETYRVTAIGEDAFEDNQLTAVTLSDSVESIGVQAFYNNPGLGLVTVEANDPPALDATAFANANRHQIDLVVPIDKIQEYLDNGWDGFRSISHGIFTVDDIKYEIIAPNEVMVLDYTGMATELEIPETVDDNGETYTVTAIGEDAFWNKQLTAVNLPDSVERIGSQAFANNTDLGLVTVGAVDPPVLDATAFVNANRHEIYLVVPIGKIQEYLDNGWGGFRSISHGIFTLDDIKYGIIAPNEVMVLDYTGMATELEIPETVDDNGETYTVTAIGEDAFWNKQLTAVNLPDSVERIGSQAFANNPDLGLVTVRAVDPPVLDATAFVNANRHEIYLVVPKGRMQVYEDNGWGGFRSISEDGTPPQPNIGAPQSIDDLGPFTVSITFDGEVTDFGVDDIQVTNATVSALTGSGFTYTATITPTSPCGIAIAIPANVATGVNGLPNPAAQQVSVGIMDTIAPTITCPANVVANTADNGKDDCTTTVGLGSPVVDDNCSVATVVAQINGTDIDPDTYEFSAGTTIVTWIVSDATGNTTSCEQTVTVEVTRNCESRLLTDFNRGFSPNGDGIADTLVIKGLEKYRNNVVRIYDLSQRLLFSIHYGGPGDAWDGTHEGGTVPVGPYVCVIDFNEPGLDQERKMIYVNY
ncbi:leucine-rich repeat protein [Muricauda sp. SCSIO 64092]|uniref:leucine-rich repeat protein n=1 Tax=Allomuricauda sp. SCSIO 64092 TaxID=2908842 RepID=UPI001FF3151A|nr:leucine-rich repeat protein [Muricauda sp. SCSIO 64092]UOY05802.1 leucine-rich repeat protein [Muricauda sp. SCSIO 64092]